MTNRITIKIETDNAAFDNYGEEVARILRRLADDIEDDGTRRQRQYTHNLYDINGNKVGEARV
jgi:hypothetical protein